MSFRRGLIAKLNYRRRETAMRRKNNQSLIEMAALAFSAVAIGSIPAQAQSVTATVAAGTNPLRIAVNPVTNKIYVANQNSNNVTVIDGATNSTTTVPVGGGPTAVAVNPVSNKIYVVNIGNVTVIDGVTNSTTTVAAGGGPTPVAENPDTNTMYYTSNSM